MSNPVDTTNADRLARGIWDILHCDTSPSLLSDSSKTKLRLAIEAKRMVIDLNRQHAARAVPAILEVSNPFQN